MRENPLGRATLWPIIARNANDRVVSCEIAVPVVSRALWEPVRADAQENEWEATAEEAVCSAARSSRLRDAEVGEGGASAALSHLERPSSASGSGTNEIVRKR